MKKITSVLSRGSAVVVSSALLANHAMAQTANPLTAGMDSVDLTGVAVKVGAVVLLIIGVALAFKGGDLGKRVVRKV